MDLMSWSLSSIDTVYSTLRNTTTDPPCPDGTYAAGYINDAWGQWRLVCLSHLSVEDVEDVYLFGFLIIGFLTIGIGGFLIYRAVWEEKTAGGERLELYGEMLREVWTLSENLSQADQKPCAWVVEMSSIETLELVRKMDANLERLVARVEERPV